MQGDQHWYYPSGQLKRKGFYKDGKPNQNMVSYYEDGTLLLEENYKDGILVGEQKKYYPKKDGKQILSKHLFFDDQGKPSKEHKAYYPNGNIQSVTTYDYGKLHGKKIIYSEENDILEELEYKHDLVEGRYFQRLPDGREVVFHYKNNLKEGPHTVSYPPNSKGERIKAIEATYKNDMIEGKTFEYDEKGHCITEQTFKNNKKEGISYVYTPKGNVMMKIPFKNDLQDGKVIQYYPNGRTYKQTNVKNGKRDGEEKTFHENGRLKAISSYRNDLLEGLSKNFTDNEDLIFEGNYQSGERHGSFKKYYADGSLKLEQSFINDKLHGEKKKYDKDKNVVVTKYEHGKKIQ